MNNSAFLEEKRANFANFLLSRIPKGPKSSEQRATIANIANCDITQFLTYLITKVAPFADNLDKAVDLLLTEQELRKDQFAADDLAKLKRYLQCFLDCMNSAA